LKIHILCDLHVEFGNFVPPDVGADVVVLAGEVQSRIEGFGGYLTRNLKVLYFMFWVTASSRGKSFPDSSIILLKDQPKTPFFLIPRSIKYLADLPNRCDVGKIGNIPTQYWPCLRDSHVVAIPGFKIEISNADIWCRLIATAGNTLIYICFDETEWLQVLFHDIHMFCLIIVEIESGRFLIRIHNTDFIHDTVSFPAAFSE
jgi:hypothetical protein